MQHSTSLKKIVLFNPKPNSSSYFRGVPLSLLAISSLLNEKKYDIKIISANPIYDYVQRVLELSKDAICLGITCMTGFQILDGLRVAKAVKQRYPNFPIVWGGWHPSTCPDSTIMNPFVDIIVRGQGERTFAELVSRLEKKMPLNDIPGITYKQNGKIFTNPERPFEDINNFPSLTYHLTDIEKFIRKSELGSRTIEYISSQGCPYRCAFCCELSVYKRRWSGLKAERVIDDFEMLAHKYGINGIILNDSNFFVNENRVREICEGVISRNLNIKWGRANGHPRGLINFDQSTWELMKEGGCSSILIGIESGSQSVLDLINKDMMVEDTIRLVEICKRYDIGVTFSIMLGFPPLHGRFDQKINEEFDLTADLIDRILSIYKNIDLLWYIYTPYPGTPLYSLSLKAGMKEPKTLEEWSHFELQMKNTPWVPNRYVKLISQLATYVFPCMLGNYSRSLKNRAMRFEQVYELLLELLRKAAYFRWKNRNFSFMVEYDLIKLYLDRIRAKVPIG